MRTRRYDPRRSPWSSILRFLYVWAILAAIAWSPIYSGPHDGIVVPAYGSPEPSGKEDQSLLMVGERFDYVLESRWYLTNITFTVAEETEGGFLINATYRQARRPSLAEGMEIVYPSPAGEQEERFLVDRQGHPLEETYASWYWTSVRSAE